MQDAPEVPSFDQLASAHHALDQRLHTLAQYTHLTDDQQLEEVAIKKRKLALKDQMAALRHPDRHADTHA